MRRFYAPPGQISVKDRKIVLLRPEKDHIAKVLRLKPGDNICVLDGLGKKYYSTIIRIESDRVTVNIDLIKEDDPQKLKLHLFQALPKSDKFDLIVQKTTELGVASITPLSCQRSVPKDISNPQKRVERWKKISVEAAKQSGHSSFPKVGEVLKFQEALRAVKNLNCQLNLILWESEPQNDLKSIIQNRSDVSQMSLIIGPEGGFEAEEVELATNFGALPVSLGDKILRTETASIATCAIILYELGNLCQQRLL